MTPGELLLDQLPDLTGDVPCSARKHGTVPCDLPAVVRLLAACYRCDRPDFICFHCALHLACLKAGTIRCRECRAHGIQLVRYL